jgi:hypothetical protein
MRFINFFLCLWSCLPSWIRIRIQITNKDPDYNFGSRYWNPGTPLNPDPIRIRIHITVFYPWQFTRRAGWWGWSTAWAGWAFSRSSAGWGSLSADRPCPRTPCQPTSCPCTSCHNFLTLCKLKPNATKDPNFCTAYIRITPESLKKTVCIMQTKKRIFHDFIKTNSDSIRAV